MYRLMSSPTADKVTPLRHFWHLLNQDMLADMIGTTRPRVNFFMNKFRKLGFVDYNGTLRVHSSLLNVVLHD